MEGTYETVRTPLDCSDPRSSSSRCRQERVLDDVSIVLVGKYTDMTDSYMSVVKALEHSAFRCNRKLVLQVTASSKLVMTHRLHMQQWVDASNLQHETQDTSPAKYHEAWKTVVGAGCVFTSS
jgi:CTP synthase